MHAIFHAILRTISIQSPDHDTQALERAPVFCCARVFFDAVGAALRVAIEAGQTKGLILHQGCGRGRGWGRGRGRGRDRGRGRGSSPGRLFVVFSALPRTLQSVAPGSPPDDRVRGLVPCFVPPRMLQSGGSFYRIISVASDAPVRSTGFSPGRSSPGPRAVLHPAPDAPIRGIFLSYSLRCLGRSSPWHRVHPRTIQSGG